MAPPLSLPARTFVCVFIASLMCGGSAAVGVDADAVAGASSALDLHRSFGSGVSALPRRAGLVRCGRAMGTSLQSRPGLRGPGSPRGRWWTGSRRGSWSCCSSSCSLRCAGASALRVDAGSVAGADVGRGAHVQPPETGFNRWGRCRPCSRRGPASACSSCLLSSCAGPVAPDGGRPGGRGGSAVRVDAGAGAGADPRVRTHRGSFARAIQPLGSMQPPPSSAARTRVCVLIFISFREVSAVRVDAGTIPGADLRVRAHRLFLSLLSPAGRCTRLSRRKGGRGCS
jgi:hypothetical protein